MTREAYNALTSVVISAAIEVHRELGPGLLGSIYEQCLAQELLDQGLSIERQVMAPVSY
jgi:GxxExxY protein